METSHPFTIEVFTAILVEIFGVQTTPLNPDTDLVGVIKDSIDLGELVAVIKMRHGYEPVSYESFKVHTTVREVFENFRPMTA
jgi:acyl carrier protein